MGVEVFNDPNAPFRPESAQTAPDKRLETIVDSYLTPLHRDTAPARMAKGAPPKRSAPCGTVLLPCAWQQAGLPEHDACAVDVRRRGA